MRLFRFKSIRTNLTFWFLILALLPLIIGILITYNQLTKTIRKESYTKLTAIRDLKVEQLENWLTEREGDLKTASGDVELSLLEDVIFKERKDQNDRAVYARVRKRLNRYLKNYTAYSQFSLINSRTGLVEISTTPGSEGLDKSADPYFTGALQTGGLFIKDIYYSKTTLRNEMTFSIPIFCSKHKPPHVIGVLVAHVDLKNSLYALLMDRVGLGRTGETFIVNRDAVALNELQGYQNAPLKLKIDSEPVKNAARGLTGIGKTIDYHGNEVLAAYTYIPQTDWGFVAKIDMYELNAPIRTLTRKFVLLFLISTLFIVIIVFWISNEIARPVIDMNRVAQKIRRGIYSVRNIIQTRDELGSLAKATNHALDYIESQMTVQKGVVAISDTMIGKASLGEFGAALLDRLMETTGANMSAFYTLNEEKDVFEHLVSQGANADMLRPFSAGNPEGEFGIALVKKKIHYLRDIPEDTIFKYRTIAGDAIPQEIITVPILIDDRVMALISLVNIQKFSRESHDILRQSWHAVNSAYSVLVANEKTRILAEELERSYQKLQAQTEELQSQTEELSQQSEELQEQNLELDMQRKQVEEANRLKSEFLSNMSHELRTPLNSVMALSRVLIMQAQDKLNEDELKYLAIIERNGKQLLNLINDILDLSKIEAGKTELVSSEIFPESLVGDIIESLKPIAAEKRLQLSADFAPGFPVIKSDEGRLRQILQNLISNAVKFTESGAVTVSGSFDEEKIYIKVTDTGIGISEADLAHIFDEFRQADGSTARKYEGTGLGLAIARKLALILGGDLSAESRLGEGSVFTLELPINGPEELKSIEIVKKIKTQSGADDKKTVLVVDDDEKTVKMITRYLNEAGFATLSANSGKEALRLAESEDIFALTLDIIMPEMDGWEVLQNLKKNEKTKNIPVIVVSVAPDQETGYALGAVGYIGKPVNRDELIAEIRRAGGSATCRVMVVDDNEIELNQMAGMIAGQQNMQAIPVNSGAKCLHLIREQAPPDVLVVDLIMPEIDGFQVIDRLKSSADTRNLPIVVVTAKDLTEADKQQLQGKVADVFTKSKISADNFLREINRILTGLGKYPFRSVKNRILMVENNDAAIIQVKAILEKEGYIVDVAHNGPAAIEYIGHTIPDGVILDLMMPEMDGFEVLEKIRGRKETAKLPVLVLTAKDLTREDLEKLSANNIQQLVQKGDINKQGLLFKVKLMLGNEPKAPAQRVKSSAKATSLKKAETQPEPDTEKRRKSSRDLSCVLVVEDNPDNMTTLKAMLKGKYSIIESTDGETALQTAVEKIPDVILLDVSLPKMDGYELVANLKDDPIMAKIPVIALTAHAMKGDREKILAAGFDDYIAKPIDTELLLKKLQKWLSR